METGVYRHFKGGLYFVDAVAKHSETQEELVVYRNDKRETWVRPISMFFDHVEKDGYNGPRFCLVKKVHKGHISPTGLLKEQ